LPDITKAILSKNITPYNTELSKKEQVSKMFNNIAPKYDFLNRFLSLGIDIKWRKKAVALLQQLDPMPRKILDVATGTGDVAIAIAQAMPVEKIIGLDIASHMLSIGKQKIAKKNLVDQIEFIEGDSENLPFANNTFDAATVAFGVRNFENTAQGLKELWRVLSPGGTLVVLEFSKPKRFPFKQLYHFYFKHVLPVIGRMTSKDPRAYTYLFESVQSFPEGKQFLELLNDTGFKTSQLKPLTLGICTLYSAVK
jgi:demethylmenaquinone methyltransferase/2-methoxy-6-polyprenyl-1,4-benzoquinol methylase